MRTTPSLLPLPLALTLLAACTPEVSVNSPKPSDTATDTDTGAPSNTAPGTPTVTLSPDAPRSGDTLVVRADATDPDGDALTYTFAWTLDGALQADLTSDTVPGSRVARSGVWSVSVVASDGQATSNAGMATVTVANSAPTLDAVTLSPAEPGVQDSLTATAGSTDDLDGDAVAITYTWYIDGTEIQHGNDNVLPAGLATRGQTVHVVATPDDGTAVGEAVESASVSIRNTAPEAASASVSPASPTTATGATCVPGTATDPDGDTVTWSYAWLVNGTERPDQAAAELPGNAFARGDRLACIATPGDGTDIGTGVPSGERTVFNAAPTVAGVSLSTLTPIEGDTLTVALTGLVDTDATDAPTATYGWFVNGAQVSTASTLPSTSFAKGDRIHVVVTPVDALTEGEPVPSDEATVGNAPPVVSAVTLAPDTLYTNTTVTAEVTAADPDSVDTVTAYTYTWRVNGNVIAGATGSTLDGLLYFDKGQTVTVTVTASDSSDAISAPLTSTSLTVRDSAPTTPTVRVSPDSPVPGSDDLHCALSAPSLELDPTDTTPITYLYTWYVNGEPADASATFTTTAVSDSVHAASVLPGDDWECRVTPTAAGVAGTSGSDSVAARSECELRLYNETSLTINDLRVTDTLDDSWGPNVLASTLPDGWYMSGLLLAPNPDSTYDLKATAVNGTSYASFAFDTCQNGEIVEYTLTPDDIYTIPPAQCSFELRNGTGTALASMWAKPSTADTWDSAHQVAGTTAPGATVTLTLEPDTSGSYDVAGITAAGTLYQASSVVTCVDGDTLSYDLNATDMSSCTVNVTNETGRTVDYVYASEDAIASWGDDRLGVASLAAGNTLTFTLPSLTAAYDLGAIDRDNWSYYAPSFATCAGDETLNYTLTTSDRDLPATNGPGAGACRVQVDNATGVTLTHLYVYPSSDAGLGSDWLGPESLPDGWNTWSYVPANFDGDSYDIVAVDSVGDWYSVAAFDYCFDGEELLYTLTQANWSP